MKVIVDDGKLVLMVVWCLKIDEVIVLFIID